MTRRTPDNDSTDPSQEGEEDVDLSKADHISEAVVWTTDWTTETIVRALDRQNIDLNPGFQRRDAWKAMRKSKFIESLFLGLPVPPLVLAERKSARGTYIVLDGKQRLLTLRQFATESTESGYTSLKLSGLSVRKELNGLTLAEIRKLPQFQGDLTAFLNQPIRTVIVKNWPNESFLYLVFERLNTGSLPLSPQELRQALFPGLFTSFVDAHSQDSPGLRKILGQDSPDFRMRDAELLVRHIAFVLYLREYRGSLKSFLDKACQTLNSEWNQREAGLRSIAENLESAIEATYDIFGDFAFAFFNGTQYEERFNRAVYDIMTYFLRNEPIAKRALAKKKQVEAAFKKLCSEDSEFRDSLITTTKSLSSVATRFNRWACALHKVLEIPIATPRLVDGKTIEV